jgi:hypothetical protein
MLIYIFGFAPPKGCGFAAPEFDTHFADEFRDKIIQ